MNIVSTNNRSGALPLTNLPGSNQSPQNPGTTSGSTTIGINWVLWVIGLIILIIIIVVVWMFMHMRKNTRTDVANGISDIGEN